MSKVSETKISELILDDKNFNKGTQYGQHLMENSLRKFGAGRSILLDKNNRIIAGNKTTENAGAIGIEDVVIVESDGTKLIAVKRTDIDLDSKQGRELALADNATQKANLEWDMDVINELAEGFEIDVADWGVVGIDTDENEESEIYTTKIKAPTYEPTEEKPNIKDLINKDKYDELIKEIEKSDVPKDEKAFLKIAALRHIVFDYSKIAEYYAHSGKTTQELFENSALVIIDYNKAIELGYVKLRDSINEAMINDYGDEA